MKEIAYTDSFVIQETELSAEQQALMKKRAVHYVGSDKPLGTILSQDGTCPIVSAGHPKHEYTTGTSWPMIMQQFDRIKQNQQD